MPCVFRAPAQKGACPTKTPTAAPGRPMETSNERGVRKLLNGAGNRWVIAPSGGEGGPSCVAARIQGWAFKLDLNQLQQNCHLSPPPPTPGEDTHQPSNQMSLLPMSRASRGGLAAAAPRHTTHTAASRSFEPRRVRGQQWYQACPAAFKPAVLESSGHRIESPTNSHVHLRPPTQTQSWWLALLAALACLTSPLTTMKATGSMR